MAYTMIEDFAGGLDLRKSAVTTKPGSLRTLKNATVNAGGEVEKRKTLTSIGTLPAGLTKGLGFIGGNAVVFETAAAPAATLPDHVTYKQLVAPGVTISRVLSVAPFADKLYVVVRMSDNTVRHFFDGAEVVSRRGQGVYATPYKTKMYVADGKNLRFSAINAPADTSGTGSGVIDVTAQDIGSTNLLAIEPYYSNLALLGQTSIQVWAMDADPNQNSQLQVLGNIGLVAPGAVAQYGTGDILFLSHTGIRSLRARDASNSAVLNDIGSPIDSLIGVRRALITQSEVEKLTALVDPLTGQFWLIWGKMVFVLSMYPSSKVTAWSTFDLPINPDYVVQANSRILFRQGDELFIYGTLPTSGNAFDVNAPVGNDPTQYDASEVVVEMPFMDFGTPATDKTWNGLDIACEGTWDVYVNPEIRSPDAWTKIASITGPSFAADRIPLNMRSTHLAIKLVNKTAGPAIVSAVGVHYQTGEGK